jgi:hypothetical protein
MEESTNSQMFIEDVEKPRYTGFILLVMFLGFGIYFISGLSDIKNVKANWEKYRCSPSIMPFAALYGHDTQETFSFCMKNIFSGYSAELLGPFYGILGGFVKALMTLIKSANSIRLMIASLFGGITTIMQEFTNRFSQFMMRIRISAMRMKFMMYRVLGIMNSVLFMGISGITSALNFGDTVIFSLLDTICFPGDTLVEIKERGSIPIKDVKIGDVFADDDGAIVTGTFKFLGDGQAMVKMPDGTEVSSNHYVWHEPSQHWYPAYRHPDAIPYGIHNGGTSRMLYCLNTANHKFPIGKYIYRDYDETDEGDEACMAWVEKRVNGVIGPSDPYKGPFEASFHPNTPIKVRSTEGEITTMRISALQPGMRLSNNGLVIGKIKRYIKDAVLTQNGYIMAASTLVWSATANKWIRAGRLPNVESLPTPTTPFITLIVSNSAIELADDTITRDYLEVFSNETKAVYDELMDKLPL